MEEEAAQAKKYPKWRWLFCLGWFIGCIVALESYPVLGEGWYGLAFGVGVFLGGEMAIILLILRMQRRIDLGEARKKLGISKELD